MNTPMTFDEYRGGPTGLLVRNQLSSLFEFAKENPRSLGYEEVLKMQDDVERAAYASYAQGFSAAANIAYTRAMMGTMDLPDWMALDKAHEWLPENKKKHLDAI